MSLVSTSSSNSAEANTQKEEKVVEQIIEGCITTSPSFVELTPKINPNDFIFPGDQSQPIPNKIILNYLPVEMSEADLRQLCASHGPLKSFNLITNRTTGERQGYAFAEYNTSKEAICAANKLNGLKCFDKHIKVSLSRPQDASIRKANLHVTGVPRHWTIQELYDYFRFHGQLISCKILTCPISRISKGTAFLRFASHSQADEVRCRLNGMKPYGESEALIITFAHSNGPNSIKRHIAAAAAANQTHFPSSDSSLASGAAGLDAVGNGDNPNKTYLRSLPMAQPVRINPPPLTYQQVTGFMALHGPFFVGLPRPSRQYFNSWPIFVGNLGTAHDEVFLRMVFQQYGAIQSVKLMRAGSAEGGGYGFVNMWNPDEAIVAVLSLNNAELTSGQLMAVSFKPLRMIPSNQVA